MSTHRSFETDPEPREPVSFDIDGEPFETLAFVPGSVLLEHTGRLMSGRKAVRSGEMLDMWSDILDDAEHARFRKFIDDPDNRVDIQLLGEMFRWVLGQIMARPTDAPSPSAPGQSPNGATYAPEQQQTAATPSATPSTR